MLDERKEFAQYTADLTAADAPRRLRYPHINKDLSSIRRAMTIVARGALDGRNDLERIGFARDCLRLWCGHAELGKDVPEAEDAQDLALQKKLRNWLPSYLDLLGRDKMAEEAREREKKRKAGECSGDEEPIRFPQNVEKSKAKLAESAKNYAKPELNAAGEESKSNLYAITYDGILAAALEAGPLCTKYLVVSSGLDEQALFQGVKKNEKNTAKPGVNAAIARTQILKLTAMYLLAGHGKARDAAYIKISDADNYLQARVGSQEKNDPGIFPLLTLNGKQIFEKETVNTIVLLHVNRAWIERGGFVLATKDELQNYPDALYYADGDWAEKLLVSGVVKAP